MDTAEIEVFLVLAEELHFGRTADRLRLPQPRVSRLIAALERRAGGKLFDRTSRTVTLTPLGNQLRGRMQPAYAELQAALGDARAAARETAGQLRIGFTNTTEGPALSRLVTAFEARQPDCEITLQEIPVANPYTALRAGEVDVLVNWLIIDEPDLTAGPTIDWQDRVLAVAASHPLARRQQAGIEDLAGQAVCRVPPTFPGALWDALVPPATPSGKMIPRSHLVGSISETMALVAHGLVVHPTVTSVAQKLRNRGDIVFILLTGLPPMPLGLVWRTAHENARIRALADTARSLGQRASRTALLAR